MHHASMLMTEGPIGRQMIRFAVPLFIGNLFQQLYNTADALIVGRLLGNDALAAVSATGTLVFLLIMLFDGISAGAGVVIARCFGARDHERLEKTIHTALAFGLLSGSLLTAAGTALSPALLRLMGTPEDVMDLSVEYIRVFFAGSLGLVLYNSCRGIMQAVGDGKDPLHFLIISSMTNVALDLLLIGVFHTGVWGAALATVISQLLRVVLCLRKLMTTGEEYRVSLRKIGFDWRALKAIVRNGLPSGLQNSVIGLANVVVQSNINAFGTMAVAGCGAYAKVEGFGFLPITSFTIALTTFVGQNLGAREYERARRGSRFGVLCASLTAEGIGLLFVALAPILIGAFTAEPEAVAFGVLKARICGPFFFLLALSHSLAAVMRGAGKAVIPMATMLAIWCVLRVSFLQIMVPIYRDIAVVNWVYPLTWLLSTLVLGIYFFRADWIHAFERQEL